MNLNTVAMNRFGARDSAAPPRADPNRLGVTDIANPKPRVAQTALAPTAPYSEPQ